MCSRLLRERALGSGSRPFSQGWEMVIGMILMIIGGIFLTRNKNLAYLFAKEPSGHHWHFSSSIARQNFAIMGAVFFIGGLIFFLLF
jgi:hypothetical protein